MSATTRAPGGEDLLDRVLALRPAAFALLHRPERAPGVLEVLTGEVGECDRLADLPVPEPVGGAPRHDLLTVVPYRQIAERGFAGADDGAPLLALRVAEQETVPLTDALTRIPDVPIRLSGGHFDIEDAEYADIVRRVVADEIGVGEGANFVIKRSFITDIEGYTPREALVFFRRLLEQESNAYWTFLVHLGDRTFVGASPERHVSLHHGAAVMNPISGTYRYPASGPSLPQLMDFLADRKEADELYMVVDEELKMMARICDEGARMSGPYLKEMARLAHTEYLLEGRSTRDPRDILRETMFAPTVTGSPLESACRVINRYEPHGRGYYSGVMALIGQDEHGGRALDSAILIRTADIDRGGRVNIGVGATLVRHSNPESEVAETAAKAAGLIAALESGGAERFHRHPHVLTALADRNTHLAGFWLGEDAGEEAILPQTPSGGTPSAVPAELAGRRVLIVDNEDTFTAMMAHQLRSLDLAVTVRRFDEPYAFDGHELVVMGPGPGDPRATGDPRIAAARAAVRVLLEERRPFLAVCLSHQVLSLTLGLDVEPRRPPNQGVQKEIDLFGARERVGFYNTFTARCADDKFEADGVGTVEVCRDPDSGDVHALRGPRFASMQFHAESVLTQNGPRITGSFLRGLL
ncbi:anthranilate synthase family protein [Streptomyces litchfieldiae]|uniref:anthranilate synthase n=1 Tax=Streptomyces litchfieldiae TaxID=3075543 RepID=A0ABU2MW37_9ACTN|nr:anthranilate synthase family protein [Streptomyces sp. DSM 44938]MDT0345814.1 anthranilate synthase family protein [Streptomyces sp. DSM 44938]